VTNDGASGEGNDPRGSVVNVTAVVTLNKTDLTEHVGSVPVALLDDVNRGLRRVLDL